MCTSSATTISAVAAVAAVAAELPATAGDRTGLRRGMHGAGMGIPGRIIFLWSANLFPGQCGQYHPRVLRLHCGTVHELQPMRASSAATRTAQPPFTALGTTTTVAAGRATAFDHRL